jgi:hypothetical protein
VEEVHEEKCQVLEGCACLTVHRKDLQITIKTLSA